VSCAIKQPYNNHKVVFPAKKQNFYIQSNDFCYVINFNFRRYYDFLKIDI